MLSSSLLTLVVAAAGRGIDMVEMGERFYVTEEDIGWEGFGRVVCVCLCLFLMSQFCGPATLFFRC